MMDRYPVLGWIVRFGTVGTALLAAFAAIVIVVLAWAAHGMLAVVIAVVVAAVILVVGRSYVEIVTILTEMLVPR
jgi:hypothetical protein